jgi:hypothetical protein
VVSVIKALLTLEVDEVLTMGDRGQGWERSI